MSPYITDHLGLCWLCWITNTPASHVQKSHLSISPALSPKGKPISIWSWSYYKGSASPWLLQRDETVVQQNQKAVLSFTSPGFQTACMSFLATMIVDAGPMGRTRCDDQLWKWTSIKNLTQVPNVLDRGVQKYLPILYPAQYLFLNKVKEIVIPIRVFLCWNVEFLRNFSLTLALADKILAMPKTTSLGICWSKAQRYCTQRCSSLQMDCPNWQVE